MNGMSESKHPLRKWMEEQGIEATDYEAVAKRFPSGPAPESIRQIVNGYRAPGWTFAFEIEAITKISAHDLRDPKHYRSAA